MTVLVSCLRVTVLFPKLTNRPVCSKSLPMSGAPLSYNRAHNRSYSTRIMRAMDASDA